MTTLDEEAISAIATLSPASDSPTVEVVGDDEVIDLTPTSSVTVVDADDEDMPFYDYASLGIDDEKAAILHQKAIRAGQAMRRVDQLILDVTLNIFDAGKELTDVRTELSKIAEGKFKDWLEHYFPGSRATAYNYMTHATAMVSHFGGRETLERNPRIQPGAVYALAGVAKKGDQMTDEDKQLINLYREKMLSGQPVMTTEVRKVKGSGKAQDQLPTGGKDPKAQEQNQKTEKESSGDSQTQQTNEEKSSDDSASYDTLLEDDEVGNDLDQDEELNEIFVNLEPLQLVNISMSYDRGAEFAAQRSWCNGKYGQIIEFRQELIDVEVAGRIYAFKPEELSPVAEPSPELLTVHTRLNRLCKDETTLSESAKHFLSWYRARTEFTSQDVELLLRVESFLLGEETLPNFIFEEETEEQAAEAQDPEAEQKAEEQEETGRLNYDVLIRQVKATDKAGRLKIAQQIGFETRPGGKQLTSTQLRDAMVVYLENLKAEESQELPEEDGDDEF